MRTSTPAVKTHCSCSDSLLLRCHSKMSTALVQCSTYNNIFHTENILAQICTSILFQLCTESKNISALVYFIAQIRTQLLSLIGSIHRHNSDMLALTNVKVNCTNTFKAKGTQQSSIIIRSIILLSLSLA